MPELPEVETVRQGLIPVIEGHTIVTADIRRPDLRWPFPENMAARLTGQTVTALRRRSKYILADLSGGETLLIHLGMSGRILITGENATPDPLGNFHHLHPAPAKHDHVVLDFDNGARVTFNDARRFGAMDLAQTGLVEHHAMLAKLGPEPLGNAFNEAYLSQALTNRNTPIKSALLDQKLVAGLGNIYVCEALYRSRISPMQKANRISAAAVSRLVPIIRDVLRQAIAAGGSSLKDYRQTDGELGYFQHSFQVYDRAEQPCLTQGCTDKITRVVQSGRSSFFCPSCQNLT